MIPDLLQSLAEVMAENHFESKPNMIAEWFHFHKRNQLPSESVTKYVADLQHLSTHYDLGTYLNMRCMIT